MATKIKISAPLPFPTWTESQDMAHWDDEDWDEYYDSLGYNEFNEPYDDVLDADPSFSNRGVKY